MNRHGSTRRIASFIIALLPLLTASALATIPGLRIVASDERLIEIELKPVVQITRLKSGEILPHISGAVISNVDQAGAPMRMTLSIPLALPSPAGNRFEITGVEYDAPVQGRIAPVPSQRFDSLGAPSLHYRIDPSRYDRAATAGPVAELHYNGIARDLHVGAVVVEPYRYDPSTGSIRFVKSIRVRLHYAAPMPVDGRRSEISEPMRHTFVNSAAARNWSVLTVPQPQLARRPATSSARAWMRVEVKEEGLYALTVEDFRKGGIDLASVDAGRIVVYGGDGGDLPEQVSMADSNRMRPLPTLIERDGNGRVSRLLFYATGPLRWKRNAADTLPIHTLSHYISARSYIVAVDGEPSVGFPLQPPAGPATVSITSAPASVVHDEDRMNLIQQKYISGSGRGWFGTHFNAEPGMPDSRSFSTHLPGLDRSFPLHYRVRVASSSPYVKGINTDGRMSFSEGSASFGDPILIGSSNSDEIVGYAASRLFSIHPSAIAGDNTSRLTLTYSCAVQAMGFLDFFEIHYGRRLQLEQGDREQIIFYSQSGTGVGEYRISGFGGDDIIGLDVTDPARPVQLNAITISGGRYIFRDQLRPPHQRRRYLVTRSSTARTVDDASLTTFGDLRNRMLDVDILVVAHPDLVDGAKKYVAYRNGQRRYTAAYVTTDEIYTEFSHGNLDPTAIRDYIAFAWKSWRHRPRYVLLLGDACYDYRRLVSAQRQFVPSYQTDYRNGDEYHTAYSGCVDDYLVRVAGDDPLPDIAIGRIPAETEDEVETVLEKIRRYENENAFGTWKSTIILAADDSFPLGQGNDFVQQSESLWTYVPEWMEARKIYLPAYPTVSGGKPGAAGDLLDYMNRGALMFNWVGHGNPDVLAHEGLFNQDHFLPKLYNDSMLIYITAPTCTFGQFDNPNRISSSESLVKKTRKGAIAVMASSRQVYIGNAALFIYDYYDHQFQRDPITHSYPTIGDALLNLKAHGNDLTSQTFTVLGDPALSLKFPMDSVTIEKIDGEDVTDAVVTIRALSMVTVEGSIRDHSGRVRDDFNGTAILSLFDADRHIAPVENGVPQNMTLYGGRLFRGPAVVTAGRFKAAFRIPKDIAYDSTTGRLYVYAFNEGGDAAGGTTNVRVYGSDTAVVTDHEGPEIRIYLDDRTFRTGDVVTPAPLLIVDIDDTSGVNMSGAGIGHGMEAWLDDASTPLDLRDSYLSSLTEFGRGTAERRLLDLEPGDHRLRVRAWDIFNNASESVTWFRIAEGGDSTLHVEQVANYPNPMTRSTDFTFRHNQSRPLDVEIAIYTSSGRKIRQLESRGVADRFVRVHWDGADSDGHPVANGVYLYRLRVGIAGDGAGRSFETIESVAILR